MVNYLSIDTEFSSFYSPDRKKTGELLQLAIRPVIQGVRGEPFNEYCKPLTKKWNSKAEEVHKITRHKASLQQHPHDMAKKLLEYIKQYDLVFTCLGWNCKGDKLYLERLIHDAGITLDWYKHVKSEWIDAKVMLQDRKKHFPVKNYQLKTAAAFFKIPINAHEALSDADAALGVFECLKTANMGPIGVQLEAQGMSNIEKRAKFIDRKYLQIGHDSIFISEHATKNPEAMRFICEELYSLFVENR